MQITITKLVDIFYDAPIHKRHRNSWRLNVAAYEALAALTDANGAMAFPARPVQLLGRPGVIDERTDADALTFA